MKQELYNAFLKAMIEYMKVELKGKGVVLPIQVDIHCETPGCKESFCLKLKIQESQKKPWFSRNKKSLASG